MLKKLLNFLPQCALYALLVASLGCSTSFATPKQTVKSVWQVLGYKLHMSAYSHHYRVRQAIRWYLSHPEALRTLTENASPYIYYVLKELKKRGMPAELALLPMIESNYKPKEVSPVGAAGLWQLMPTTAHNLGIRINWWYDGRRDVVASTHAALNYLQYLHDYFNSWPLAFASYNTGIGNVMRAIQYNKARGRQTDYWSLPLAQQTEDYVPKLLALATILSNPQTYQLPIAHTKNQPYFTSVRVKTPLPLKKLAKLANTTLNVVKTLNPGFKRIRPAPKQNFNLLLPASKAPAFKMQLAEYIDGLKTQGMPKIIYTVKSGDSLSRIAYKHHITLLALLQENHLGTKLIKTGQTLYIPTA